MRKSVDFFCSGLSRLYLVGSFSLLAYCVTNKTPHSSEELMCYYGIPTLLCCILLVVLRLPRSLRCRLNLATLSGLVAIYSLNLGLWLLPDGYIQGRVDDWTRHRAATKLGLRIDDRSRAQVIAQLQNSGHPSAVPLVYPEIFSHQFTLPTLNGTAYYPLAGISNSTTVTSNEGGEWTIYESDERGFRNPKNLQTLSSIEIAVVGDSFTFGAAALLGEDFTSVIRAAHPQTLNFGIVGNGPLIELATLREYVGAKRPRVVLWCFFENDTSDLNAEKKSAILMKYLDPAYRQNLSSFQPDIDQALLHLLAERSASGPPVPAAPRNSIRELLLLARLRDTLHLGPPNRPTFDGPLFRQVLSRANDDVSGWGGQLCFVYLPGPLWFDQRAQTNFEYRTEVLSLVKELKIPIIDLLPVFKSQADPMAFFPFRLGGHYNAAGYRLVGQTIVDFLKAQRFDPRHPSSNPNPPQ